MPSQVTRPTPASGVTLAPTDTNQPGKGGIVPFRTATDRKFEIGVQTTNLLTAATIPVTQVLEGTGFLAGIDITVDAVLTGVNAAAVAYAADAPWSALQNIAFRAVGPDLVNIPGYALYLLNLYGGHGRRNNALSLDPNVYNLVAGAVATGGSFHYNLHLPLAINGRNLIGLLGNQDAATKYQLTTDIAPTGAIYTVAPTFAPNIIVTRNLDFCTVPAAVDARGQQQQQVPSAYGVLHMANMLRSEAAVVTGTTVNHFLRSLGNTDRLFILVYRLAAGGRSDLMVPSRITLRVGADVKFSESGAHRRQVMYDRYGFDAPAGVLVYDFISDFVGDAGFELGDDWFNSTNVPNAQFEVTYPTFAGGPGTLDIITDQLVIPQGLDVKPYV